MVLFAAGWDEAMKRFRVEGPPGLPLTKVEVKIDPDVLTE